MTRVPVRLLLLGLKQLLLLGQGFLDMSQPLQDKGQLHTLEVELPAQPVAMLLQVDHPHLLVSQE